jgi:hypothetical protein
MIHLWIKGNIADAIRSAKERGILLLNLRENRVSHSTETLAETSVEPENVKQVVGWFCENTTLIPELGFPNGTLLFFKNLP